MKKPIYSNGMGYPFQLCVTLIFLLSLASAQAQPVIGTTTFNTGTTSSTTFAPAGTTTPINYTLDGWNITHVTTGTGAFTRQYTSGEHFLQFSTPTGANFSYIDFGSSNGSEFKLNSLEIGSITRALTYNFTGYRNGSAVVGATHSATFAMVASSSANYGFVDFSSISGFNNIDVVRVTTSTTQAGSLFIRVDDLAIASAVTGVLPLNLIDFTAINKNSEISVNWETSYESNVARFEVEKSIDGAAFTKIGTVASKGNDGVGTNKYRFLDAAINAEMQYYRLKMIDIDGTFTYSKVQTVSSSQWAEKTKVYPNPLSGNTLNIELASTPLLGVSYRLLNSSGVTVMKGELHSKVESINVSPLAKGLYLLQLQNGDVLKLEKK